MARARSGSSVAGGVLVVFGIAWFICLLLAIIFYVQLTGAREDSQTAQNRLRQVISPSEESNPTVTALGQGRGATVVGALLAENELLKNLVGDPQLSAEALQEQARNAQISGPLLQEVQRLRSDLQAAQQQLEQARADMEQARQQAQQAQAQLAALGGNFDQAAEQLKQQLAQVTGQFEAYQKQVQQMEQQLRSQMEQARRQAAQQLEEAQSRVSQAEQENANLRTRIAQYEAAAGGVEPPDQISPDGRIASILDNQQQVYIDLGQQHRIVLGMTFEVFDRNGVVKPDPEGNSLRGKATIEVINVGPNSSIARIVRRQHGAVIREGDQIINIAYDPNTTYKFFIYGDFDLDGDGTPTPADREAVQSLIRRWGGTLAQSLSYDVDFVVLGREPVLPDPLPPGTIDPVQIKEHVEATQNYERYQQIIGEARSLSVPVLNQNRFLALVGHYQR